MTGLGAAIRADALALPIASESVDLVVTSPPYFALRAYRDGGEAYGGQIGSEASAEAYVEAIVEACREMARVLRPSGSLWLNLGDKYVRDGSARSKSLLGLPWRVALRCTDDLGLLLRAEVIWSKPNGLPEKAADRVRRSHEAWFHLTRSPRYYCDLDALREPHATEGGLSPEERRADPRYREGALRPNLEAVQDGVPMVKFAGHPLGRAPGSVWEIPIEPLRVDPDLGVEHHAAFPSELPRRIILGWSPPGGVVLDPFGGSGTTAAVARALGRLGISADMSADYCRLADWRIRGAGYPRVETRVRDRTPSLPGSPPEAADQLALF